MKLVSRWRKSNQDSKQNGGFHSIKRPLLKDGKCVWPRYLDPGDSKGAKKDLYSLSALYVLGHTAPPEP